MKYPTTLQGSLALALLATVAGCAQQSGGMREERVSVHCPTGQTMTCEVDTVGRIHHGTFRKNLDKCACVSQDTRPLESPDIPTIHP